MTPLEAYQFALKLHQQGQNEQAQSICEQILVQEPTHAETVHLLGAISHLSGKGSRAQKLIARAIALNPANAEFHSNLGEVYRLQGRITEAISAYRRTLELQPAFVAAQNNLGLIHLEQAQLTEAARHFHAAIRGNPSYATGHFNLGCVFEQQGRPADAASAYQHALKANPVYGKALTSLGRLLYRAARLDDARQILKIALTVSPIDAATYLLLGNVDREQGDVTSAISCYRKAIHADPRNHMAHSNLVYALWFHPAYNITQILLEHERWQHQHALNARPAAFTSRKKTKKKRRLRIGYVSPNFNSHVIGRNLLPLFRHHDPALFETYCYSDNSENDAQTEEFRFRAHKWRDSARWSTEKMVQSIASDGIDILVDLTLHLARNRLLVFSAKPAPIQVTFAGYPGTTGLRAIKYRLTDTYLDPIGAIVPYVEEPMYLRSFWCYAPSGAEPSPRSQGETEEDSITFGCLNNFSKVNDDTLRTWAHVLRLTPNSRLVLLTPDGTHRSRTVEKLMQEGLDPKRIEFVGRLAHAEYMAMYQRIDIALDTLPYNGHTTNCDALWMGVPVVTRVGQTVVGRAGLSQLSNIGLPDLVAHTEDEFVQIAVSLAHDHRRRNELHATLRTRMQNSVLMDGQGFTRSIEAAYREMWYRWCEELPPVK